jgi:hypothetical protein
MCDDFSAKKKIAIDLTRHCHAFLGRGEFGAFH